MAKIETTFIRPKELYTPETGETKVVYDGYQNNPHELVVEENLEGEVSEIVNDTFVPNEGGNVVFTDNNETEHELITKDGFAGALDTALAKAQVIETTWQELKDKRDNGQLIAGSLYRITDYNCTTTQENTQSAGHQFDIVLLALSANKLAEEGWAMMHDNIYDVTFTDGVTKKCYVYITSYSPEDIVGNVVILDTMLGREGISIDDLDEQNKTCSVGIDYDEDYYDSIQYNYFQNSNLSAWKVWYCLDNDTSRFAWADDNIRLKINVNGDVYITTGRVSVEDRGEYLCWGYQSEDVTTLVYTKGTPKIGDSVYTWSGSPSSPIWSTLGIVEEIEITNGRGVIYRLVDEFNNDIKYDFKNIQFVRKLTDGAYDADNGTNTWCYTLNIWYNDMCQDASIVGNTLQNDEGYIIGVYGNVFGYTTAYDLLLEGVNTFVFALGNNVVLSFTDNGYYGIYSNTIGNGFHSNTIGNNFNSNTMGNYFCGNTIGNNFYSNTIGNEFYGNTIEDDVSSKNYGNNGVELATKS